MGMACRQKKQNSNGKRGFTLAEICIVLALVAILSAMTVTFSTLTGNTVAQNREDYRFLEQCDLLRQNLTDRIAAGDGTVAFTQSEGEPLKVNGQALTFEDGKLLYGDTEVTTGLTEVKEIAFDIQDKLIKCTVTSTNGKTTQVLAFALHSGYTATWTEPTGGETDETKS